MKKLSSNQKELLRFGISIGVLVFVLQLLESQSTIKSDSASWLIGLAGFLFLAVGVWVGVKMVKDKKTSMLSKRKGEPEAFGLSDREMDVLLLMADGLSNKEIAEKLFVSQNTVKTHSSRIFTKLHAKRRTQAIQKAREHELIE